MTTPDKDIRFSVTAEDRFSRVFHTMRREMSGARDDLGGIAAMAGRASGALSTITLGSVAGIGGIGLMVKRLADDLDAFNDSADATGSSVEKLSQLERVARENGEGLDLVTTATAKLNKVLSEAKADSPMAESLKRIGLSAEDLRKLDPADAVREVAVALAGYAIDGDKARLIQELMGKSAKELAPFLKDLAESGQRNVTVTTEQAEEAEKFNKQLFLLQANARDAGRAIANDLLPPVNRFFADMREGGLAKALGLDDISNKASQAVSAYRLLSLARERVTPLSILEKDPKNEKALAQLADIDRRAKEIGQSFKSAREQYLGLSSAAAAGRGLASPEVAKPRIGPATEKPGKSTTSAPTVSEAQRYLETLQKQGEKLQQLTTLQQLEADISNKRIDGLTPKLTNELRLAAQKVDLQRQANAEAERELGLQKLLAGKDQRDIDEVQRLLSQTKTGRLQGLETQADKLRDFASRIGQDDPRTQQVLEAMRELRKEAERITAPTDEAKSAYDQLADSIEKSMERSTGAVIDFVLSSKSSVSDLGKAFAYDVLRGLIEEPVRKVMKNVAKEISDAISGQGSGDLLGSLWKIFIGAGSGAGGGGGGDPGVMTALSSLFGGFTGRAGGGGVQAGQLVRWQENGTEYFVPGANGSVLSPAMLKGMGGQQITQNNTYVINGAQDPAAVQRQIEAAVARSEGRMARAMRYGASAVGV